MVYDCGCGVVDRTNRFTNSTEMRLFWLPMSRINYNKEPFTHICEWRNRSPSTRYSGSSLWILVVETMALGSASIIYFPLSFLLSISESESEHASDSEAFILATNDCLARHSLMFLVGLLWNSHHFHVPFFVFMVFFFVCSFDGLSNDPGGSRDTKGMDTSSKFKIAERSS